MSQSLVMSSGNTVVLVDKEEIDEDSADVSETTIDDVTEMTKIVDDVETRLIQEEIQKELSQEVNPPGFLSELGVGVGILSIPASLVLVGFLFIGIDFSLIPSIGIGLLPAIAGGGLLNSFFNKDEKYTNKQEKLENLRKELVEKSLKGHILEGAEKVGENWEEVLLSKDKDDDNAEVFKRYIRILKDESTGFETVKAKKFGN